MLFIIICNNEIDRYTQRPKMIVNHAGTWQLLFSLPRIFSIQLSRAFLLPTFQVSPLHDHLRKGFGGMLSKKSSSCLSHSLYHLVFISFIIFINTAIPY